MTPEDRKFVSKWHHVSYYQGRKHVIFNGRMLRSFRVWQWMDSNYCHRERFARDYRDYRVRTRDR